MTIEYAKLVNKAIKKRHELGLSQLRLAEKAGVDRKTISRFENGKDVYTRTFLKMNTVLEVV